MRRNCDCIHKLGLIKLSKVASTSTAAVRNDAFLVDVLNALVSYAIESNLQYSDCVINGKIKETVEDKTSTGYLPICTPAI